MAMYVKVSGSEQAEQWQRLFTIDTKEKKKGRGLFRRVGRSVESTDRTSRGGACVSHLVTLSTRPPIPASWEAGSGPNSVHSQSDGPVRCEDT